MRRLSSVRFLQEDSQVDQIANHTDSIPPPSQAFGGCGEEFCFACSAPLTPTMNHGNHFHRPQCDFYPRHSCREIRKAVPDHANCAQSNEAVCCEAKCITNGSLNCARDEFSPGPCAACKDTPAHNACTHSEWRPCG